MPTTTVGAIIIDKPDKPSTILLTRRNIPPFKGYWCLPGGHFDPFEEAEDAVIREVKEETGLDFSPHFFNYFDEIFKEGSIHNIVLMFYGTTKGKIRIQESEVMDIQWFTIENAMKLDLAFTHKLVLEDFVNRILSI